MGRFDSESCTPQTVIHRSPPTTDNQGTRRPLPQLFLFHRSPTRTLTSAGFPLQKRADVSNQPSHPSPIPFFIRSHPKPSSNPTSGYFQVPHWFHYAALPRYEDTRCGSPTRSRLRRARRSYGLVAFPRLQSCRLVRHRRFDRRNPVCLPQPSLIPWPIRPTGSRLTL